MDRYPLAVSLSEIQAELAGVVVSRVADGSGHGGEGFYPGWISGISNTRLFLRHPKTHDDTINEMHNFPRLADAIEALRSQTGLHRVDQIMVNVLHAGGKLAAHRDGLPDNARFHLPIVTAPEVIWWDENQGERHMDAGFWHGPVPYCGILHSVTNGSRYERLHIIVDFQRNGV